MFRKLFPFSKKKTSQKRHLRNNGLLQVVIQSVKVLLHNEASKEACVLSYYGLLTCIPIIVFFLRLSQHLFTNLNWKEWLIIKFPDYKKPIVAIVEAAYHATESNIGLVLVGSFFVFCWAGILMLLSLEDGLNKIFRTSWTPISLKRLVSYFVITLVSPMIFIIVCGAWIYITQIMPIQYAKLFSLSHSMTTLYFISRLVPYLLLYLALFCCYAFLPRVAIQKTKALISTLIIGSLWIVFQKAFFSLQVSLFNYSFTYGALVALPSFLLLLYIYAIIYLFGGALTFIIQNRGCTFVFLGDKILPSCYLQLITSTYILALTTRQFNEGRSPLTPQFIAKHSKVPIGEVSQCLDILEKEGFIFPYNNGYQPVFNFSEFTIKDVADKLLHREIFTKFNPDLGITFIENSFQNMFNQASKNKDNLTLSEIASRIK
ncbi:YihY/virulence factor BrkB family protein [Candidatus Chlamydia corallus]|uniref:YihY/virulence factor BrkB family protein n=1 Tax=Candidatus Chlamydia corallus TaxID=2038470 RepID=UPI000C2FE0B9|nr:YihY/virulence factor BrkB family protein [Candidatus Chlamydia corallus]